MTGGDSTRSSVGSKRERDSGGGAARRTEVWRPHAPCRGILIYYVQQPKGVFEGDGEKEIWEPTVTRSLFFAENAEAES